VDDDSRPQQAYLAAGSGFAPVRALVESAQQRGGPAEVVVVMSARSEEHLIDAVMLQSLEDERSGFTYVRTLTRADGPPPVGRLPAQLTTLVPVLAKREIFAAGPPGFVRACADAARDAGAPGVHIHTEEFYFEPHPWTA